MISNITQSPLRLYSRLPKSWPDRPLMPNYDRAEERFPGTHYEDGWRDYVAPSFNLETHKLGNLIYDAQQDVVTKEVIALTPEQIAAQKRNQALSQAEMRKEEIIQQKLRDDALNYFQALPAEDAFQNKEVYPMWSGELVWVESSHKYLEVIDGELVLWEVVQAYAPKDYAFTPSELPALWKRVALTDQILPWSEPVGAHDAYQVGDEVTHNGQTWVSNTANNVWEPGVFGWDLV